MVTWREDRAGVLAARVPWATVEAAVVSVGFTGLLAAVIVAQASEPPALLPGWRIASLSLLFAVLVGSVHQFGTADVPSTGTRNYVLFLAASVVLFEALSRSRSPGIGPGWHRGVELAIVFSLVIAVLVVYPDYRRFTRAQWAFVGALAVVVGLFFVHTLGVRPDALASRWPLWAGLVAGINLLVVPRFVPDRAFLWASAGLSALATLLGARAALVGEYAVLSLEVGVWGTTTVPGTSIDLPELQSVFGNPNTLGLLAFAGVAASVVLLCRCVGDGRWRPAVVAAALGAIDAVGLLLSQSRASWLAAALTVGLYLAYVGFGRRAVLPATIVGALVAVGSIAAVFAGVVSVDPANRFRIWHASLRAIAASPTLFGEGHVSTARFIAPYLSGGVTYTPHNSYLSMFVRTGLVGGLAYVGLVAGGILHGAITRRSVNLAALALAFGWAVHHAFESYTMVQWTIPAVLSSLAFGYLLFGPRQDPDAAEE